MEHGQVYDALVRFADTLTSDYDVHLFLQDLCEAAVALFEADSAAVLLSVDDSDELHLAAGSDALNWTLAEHQRSDHEGPGVEAFEHGVPVTETDLLSAKRGRWPKLSTYLARAGHESVHAVPLRHRGDRIGALNVFWNRERVLRDDERAAAQALADVAAIGLLYSRTVETLEARTEQLQGALDSRVVVEQAKGVLAAHHGIRPEEAFTMLRKRARDGGRRLHEVAHEVVEDVVEPR